MYPIVDLVDRVIRNDAAAIEAARAAKIDARAMRDAIAELDPFNRVLAIPCWLHGHSEEFVEIIKAICATTH